MADQISSKNGIVCILLAFFLGPLGIHRFYVGKIGTGVLTLITMGIFGLWPLIDIIMMILGKFKDSEGKIVALTNTPPKS